jgi:hypothetical protein
MQRFFLRRLLVAFIASQGAALAADPLTDHLRACASEPNDAKRLACYDHEMAHETPERAADVGMTGQLLRRKQAQAGLAPLPTQNMTAAVTALAKRPYGEWVVTLDNGQVWVQQEVADFPLKIGDVITIKPGMLGALWMVGPSERVETRVKRIK